MKKRISIVSSCYNEAENIPLLYERILKVFAKFPEYDYEFVLADNGSTDGTRDVLRRIAASDPNFKVILNAGNFGHIRSPYNAFLQATGDAVVMMCSDLQEPPEVLEEFIRKWQEGYKIAAGVRSGTNASHFLEFLRGLYYASLRKIAPDQQIIQKFTGFGLYDRAVVEAMRKYHEPYPYFRGLVSEVGFRRAEVPFVQAGRLHGKTKNNFFTLYDMAMTGFVNHTKLPLRLAVFSGFILGFFSFLVSMAYLILKLIFWNTFDFGMAPLMIGMFFFASIQLIFIGILGEYIGAIWTQVKDRPLVIEEEKLNFGPEEKK